MIVNVHDDQLQPLVDFHMVRSNYYGITHIRNDWILFSVRQKFFSKGVNGKHLDDDGSLSKAPNIPAGVHSTPATLEQKQMRHHVMIIIDRYQCTYHLIMRICFQLLLWQLADNCAIQELHVGLRPGQEESSSFEAFHNNQSLHEFSFACLPIDADWIIMTSFILPT